MFCGMSRHRLWYEHVTSMVLHYNCASLRMVAVIQSVKSSHYYAALCYVSRLLASVYRTSQCWFCGEFGVWNKAYTKWKSLFTIFA